MAGCVVGCSEGLKALSLLLRGHACKLNNPSTDKAEALHLRECIIEVISAYPPMAIKVRTEAVDRDQAWGRLLL